MTTIVLAAILGLPAVYCAYALIVLWRLDLLLRSGRTSPSQEYEDGPQRLPYESTKDYAHRSWWLSRRMPDINGDLPTQIHKRWP